MVLLPGLDGTGALFREFLQALDPAIRAAVLSYPCDRHIDYAGLEAVARSLLPRHDPFVLLGESFSGPIAIEIAASRPAGLRGLILVCSFARSPYAMLTALRPFIRFLPVRSLPAALLSLLAFGRFKTPEFTPALVQALAEVPPSIIRGRIGDVLGVDVSASLAHIDVPVLYLRASQDRLVPRSASKALAAIPDIRFAEVEGPHFLLPTRPSGAAAHIHAFLREIAFL